MMMVFALATTGARTTGDHGIASAIIASGLTTTLVTASVLAAPGAGITTANGVASTATMVAVGLMWTRMITVLAKASPGAGLTTASGVANPATIIAIGITTTRVVFALAGAAAGTTTIHQVATTAIGAVIGLGMVRVAHRQQQLQRKQTQWLQLKEWRHELRGSGRASRHVCRFGIRHAGWSA